MFGSFRFYPPPSLQMSDEPNFKGYFNGKLVKEETLYLESNSSLLDLSLGNFNKDVRRVEEQGEAK